MQIDLNVSIKKLKLSDVISSRKGKTNRREIMLEKQKINTEKQERGTCLNKTED